jgi:formylglycine-generating enzyme required for sulfatase activity
MLVALGLGACQWFGGYAEFDATEANVLPTACAALPVTKQDEKGLALLSRLDIPGGTCLWIDSTEVTVEQYRAWLDQTSDADVRWEPTWCSWKTARSNPLDTPDDACTAQMFPLDSQPFAPRKPMRCLDFCDAEAFCEWAGKRLCYDRSALGSQGPRNNSEEWQLACSNDYTTRYPWGNAVEQRCNVGQTVDNCVRTDGSCGPTLVGGERSCVNERGVTDLVGNVAEWVFSCNYLDPQAPPAPTGCMTRGGGYDMPLRTCDVEDVRSNDTRAPDIGFRCCADLTSAEELAVKSAAPLERAGGPSARVNAYSTVRE